MLSQNHDFMLDGEYTIGNNGSISDGENTYDILVSGTIPNSGYLNISKGSVVSGCIQINEFAVTIEDKKVSSTTKGNCVEVPVEVVVEEFPTVTDTTPGIICGNGETEDYDNSDTCYIYSVEDLVAFSNMVNSGKNFSGKTVMLMNGLDINEDKSYADVTTNQFGDVNGNGTTSTTLKEELTDTTAKGFKPIGNNSNTFAGTFDGNTRTIRNIFINRSSESYVGLFGYNSGTIKGLKVTNGNVTGYMKLGVLAGESNNKITSVIVNGTVSGYKQVGVIVGVNVGQNSLVEGIANGNLNTTVTCRQDIAYAGGLTGYLYNGTTKGIYTGGTITHADCYGTGRAIGYNDSSNKGTIKAGALNTITINGSTKTSVEPNSEDGYDITLGGINNIGNAETTLDTYIGGDNNNDGYYYDNDENGNLTIYSTREKPLNITMTGSGTEADPYIINNYNDLKQSTYDLTKHYRLNADIDLTNKNQIMIGSVNNQFTGVFDGNTHTISNVNLMGYRYIGLFGYNSGTIKGLKVNGNVIGYERLGVLAGESNNKITSVIVNGTVSGYKQVGVIVGVNVGQNSLVEGIANGNLNTTVTCRQDIAYAGGLTGYLYNGTTKGIYTGGTITHADCYGTGRAIGYNDSSNKGTIKAGALNTITINGSTKTSVEPNSEDGYDITLGGINNIGNAETTLDTYIGGDNNNDGYYYDNDENGNLTIYSTREKPLSITMQGSGTESNPYIINNYNDLKQATYDVTKHYRLNADIDLTNKNPIMIGSEANHFTGVFDGNTHTISNANLMGHRFIGLFGYNTGVIKGLKVNGNVIGYERLGVLAGQNQGSITSVIVNGNVTGIRQIGVIVGVNNAQNALVEGVASGNLYTNETCGHDIGYSGGITGFLSYGTARGIYLNGSITYTDCYGTGRSIGYNYSSYPGTIQAGALNSITLNGNTVSSSSTSNEHGKSYTAAELQTLAPYQEVGLNTSSTSGEYRYALDSNNNYNPYLIKN